MSSHLIRVSDIRPPPVLAAWLPEQATDEFEALVADITQHGVQVPHIVCMDEDAGKYLALDGRHRLKAAAKVGLKEVPCTRLPGLGDDARLERGLALNNSRNLNGEQKRKLAADLLRKWPDRSDHRIAKLVGCSHPTVADVRAELAASGHVEKTSTRTDSQGRRQPSGKPRRCGRGQTNSQETHVPSPLSRSTLAAKARHRSGSAAPPGGGGYYHAATRPSFTRAHAPLTPTPAMLLKTIRERG